MIKLHKQNADAAKAVDVTAGLLPEDQRSNNLATKYPAFLSVVMKEIEEN